MTIMTDGGERATRPAFAPPGPRYTRHRRVERIRRARDSRKRSRMDATVRTLGQPRALVSRAALLHNVKVLRRLLPETTKICAVIKADAYGHGASIVAD